ncbi:MAG TPA: response regulator [Micavibrio sp.]|jgi:two-component system cell cycle response regulator CpdR|nr:response regulator [Pseudomonadota bacterium]HIF25210.1 response regulator [Micavibrio sp.]HIL28207.1 response regulator [Micavibrio sp.]
MAKILIAEDDTSMRGFLKLALEKAGHEVTVAGDGMEALDILKRRTDFNLLLADIVMPGMDGIELSQRATDMVKGMKVMFITGFAAVAMNNKDTEPAGARVLSKPFHLKELVDQVDDLLAA